VCSRPDTPGGRRPAVRIRSSCSFPTPRWARDMRWTRRAAATIRIAAQILGLWIILQGGESLAARSPFPIPGNVLGMTLLFLLLMLGLAKESWLSAGAG